MFTYSHTNTTLGQSEGAYYLSYFIITGIVLITMLYILVVMHTDIGQEIQAPSLHFWLRTIMGAMCQYSVCFIAPVYIL